MEQAREARALEQEEAGAKVAEAKVAGAVLVQAPGEIVFAPAVAKECPTSKARLALTKDAPSAAQQ